MANIAEDNFLVWNQGKAPLVGHNFMLRVELLFDLPCKSVKAFTREMEYELIQEGGLNDYVHMRRKPISKPFTFEVERYVGVDYIDPMPVGAQLTLPVLLFVSRYQGQFIPGIVARTFVFTGCTVIKKVYGELNAERSDLMTETTTIAYNEMLCVDLPWSSIDALNIASGVASPINAKSASDDETEQNGEEQPQGETVSPSENPPQIEDDIPPISIPGEAPDDGSDTPGDTTDESAPNAGEEAPGESAADAGEVAPAAVDDGEPAVAPTETPDAPAAVDDGEPAVAPTETPDAPAAVDDGEPAVAPTEAPDDSAGGGASADGSPAAP